MNSEHATTLAASIREYYGRIAEGNEGELSTCGCNSTPAGRPETPPPGENARLPNLGCGSPLDFASVKEGMTVVDLGSGSGRELFMAAAETGPTGTLIGIDMTPAMVDLARRNAGELRIGNAEFILGQIDAIPLPDATADRVISNCVLNLTPDKKRSFSEIHRILKPGGRVSVSDIVSTGALPASTLDDPEAWCACIAGAISRADYLEAIRDAGFSDVTVVAESGGCSCGDLPLASITVTARR